MKQLFTYIDEGHWFKRQGHSCEKTLKWLSILKNINFDYILRKPTSNVTRQALDWNPQG